MVQLHQEQSLAKELGKGHGEANDNCKLLGRAGALPMPAKRDRSGMAIIVAVMEP